MKRARVAEARRALEEFADDPVLEQEVRGSSAGSCSTSGKAFDLDTERLTLTVRQGKGSRVRMIPTGPRAAAWARRWPR